MFFYSNHFILILQYLRLIVGNTFSHIIICMFDEVFRVKLILILHSHQKNLFLPQKLTNLILEGKQYLDEGIL